MEKIEELKNTNALLREDIDDLIFLHEMDKKEVWKVINALIENELQQEELCNEN